tara:strand:- start:1256 stop:2302 length:1047 start_codon:yes stop_codon:yes gene_type:complete
MKMYKLISIILIVFLKTETLLSKNNLFNVNNIRLEKKDKTTNNQLANQAIKKGFNQLISKILLEEDIKKLSNLNFSSIKKLVTYYQISNIPDEEKKDEQVNFSVTFDKDKIHDLFYQRGILYSRITDKELYVLPILTKENEIYIFSNNQYYENWNKHSKVDLIEFILPLENIEIIKLINENKKDLINLELNEIFQEYSKNNLAIIIIQDSGKESKRAYIKSRIQGKNISKNLILKKQNQLLKEFDEKIVVDLKKELVSLVKAENLIDIRTPSFLNVKLNLNKKSNLVELNLRMKNIDTIENIFVQEFNNEFMKLRIKYLGKLDKTINQLRRENINLKLINDQWVINTL